jgi:hypothetical protein
MSSRWGKGRLGLGIRMFRMFYEWSSGFWKVASAPGGRRQEGHGSLGKRHQSSNFTNEG